MWMHQQASVGAWPRRGRPPPRGRWQPSGLLVISLLVGVLVAPAWAASQFTGRVVGITDGDTIEVLRDGKAVKVRSW